MYNCNDCFNEYCEFGTYENKTRMICRFTDRIVWIDNCMLHEIAWLWKNNVRTLECCCGHGKAEPYICVHEDYIDAIKCLGYVHTDSKPEREDLFKPKYLKERKI